MNRTCFRGLVISGETGIGNSVLIDVCDQQIILACYFNRVEIHISADCPEKAFRDCVFHGCLFILHPDGPKKKAFDRCIFDDDCEFNEQNH